MVADAPVIDNVTIVREVPETFRYYQESQNIFDLLLNEPSKRSHKPTDFILYQYDILSIGFEINKIGGLYIRYKKIFPVDFNTFLNSYLRMADAMDSIIPKHSEIVTDVSIEDECLYNYYEFDDKKIFFNLFFDEEGKESPVAVVNLNSKEGFRSFEGSIEKTFEYLKKSLETTSNV